MSGEQASIKELLEKVDAEPVQVVESSLIYGGIAAVGAAVAMRILASHIAADLCVASDIVINSCITIVFLTANPFIKGASLFGGVAIALGMFIGQYWGRDL